MLNQGHGVFIELCVNIHHHKAKKALGVQKQDNILVTVILRYVSAGKKSDQTSAL